MRPSNFDSTHYIQITAVKWPLNLGKRITSMKTENVHFYGISNFNMLMNRIIIEVKILFIE